MTTDRHRTALRPLTCPACHRAGGLLLPATRRVVVVELVRVKGSQEIISCWKCHPCDRIWCAVEPLRRVA